MKLLLLILTFAGTTVFAQNDESAVKQAVDRLFQAMKRSDTVLLRQAFTREPLLQTVIDRGTAGVQVVTEPLDSMVALLGRPHAEVYDERIRFDAIRIDGPLATVWAPYRFYLGERFSHCGVDAFQLVKQNGEWRIQYIIDTRRREGCE